MKPFVHTQGELYRIMEGVRRAKAGWIHEHSDIRAEIIDPGGQSLGEGELPIEALRSPKALIRRITLSDETRWQRVVAGAKKAALPYPPVMVQPCGEWGTRIEDVGFDFGGHP